MAITKYIVQALALTSSAYAACSAESATTIVNPAGASALATCTKYEGDVVLATGVASLKNTVDLGNKLTEITGQLTYLNDPQVASIKAGSLQKVGDLKFSNLSALAKLDLSSLTEAGDLEFSGLAILQDLGLGGSLSKAKSVKVINNQVTSIKGIDTLSQIDSLVVSDNLFLSKIDLSCKEIQDVEIGSGKDGQTSSMPNLVTANNLVFRNMSSVSLPKLVNVTENLEILACFFQSFSAPKLTTTGGFFCNDNPNLTNVTLPALTDIKGENGAFQIANNTKLLKIEGFQALENVDFNIDLSGGFSDASFPKLNNVGGAFTVDTSAKDFDCPKIKSFEGNVVKGKVECQANDDTPTKADGTGGSDSGNNNGSGAGSVNVPLFLAATTVVSSMLSMLFL